MPTVLLPAYRTVLRLLYKPEKFDMDKYEATLSQEEIDALMTGEGMKYDKRHNQNTTHDEQTTRKFYTNQ